MKEQPLISVIVPVYGVEKYLDRCVQSIVDQTYANLEIILVDDGSPDRCPAMCDAWAAKDSRIRVIHKKNGGLSDARNAGMAVAAGELMGFVDSDDWISPDMYQLLYENMKAHDSDMSVCGIQLDFEDGTPSRMLTRSGTCVLDAAEAMRAVLEESWLKQPVVQKLYKTDLIRHILFPVGKYHEDVFWTYQVVGRAKSVSVFDKPCYFYTQRGGSIMGEGYSLKRLDTLEAQWNRLNYVLTRYPQLEALAKKQMTFSCMYVFQKCLCYLSGEDLAIAKSKIMAYLKDLMPPRWSRTSGLKQQIWIWLMYVCPVGTCLLRNKLRIGI